jgi:rubrerythrin
MVATLCFIWGAFMYVVGTYTSFFGGSLNLVPILIGGYIILFVGLHLYERKYWTNIVVDKLTYAPLKLLLLNVTLDTEKHRKLLKNIIKILSHEQTVPSNEAFRREVDQVREVLEEHVHIEEDIGKKVGAVMKTVDSRVLRELLKTIRDDEMAHHTMFQMVLRTYGST